MVKLSEILRKTQAKEAQDDRNVITEAVQRKEEKPNIKEIEQLYDYSVISLKKIMEDAREGKSVEGKDVFVLAQVLINALTIEYDTLLTLVNTKPYEKDKDFHAVHAVNVAALTTNIGLSLELDRDKLTDLGTAALLHDLGMLIIPQEIILKPEKLTTKEYDLIKMHPAYGLKILRNFHGLPEITSDVISQHHEKIDGTGYPEGKKGDQISKYAQIVGIAETFEALTHPRPYRTQTTIPSEGVKIIVTEESKSYQREILKAFLDYISFFPVGSFVLLNTNEIAKVISINRKFPLRPIVDIVLDANKEPLERTKTIDLSKSPPLYIEKGVDERNFFHRII